MPKNTTDCSGTQQVCSCISVTYSVRLSDSWLSLAKMIAAILFLCHSLVLLGFVFFLIIKDVDFNFITFILFV